jgi:hypothetical protein
MEFPASILHRAARSNEYSSFGAPAGWGTTVRIESKQKEWPVNATRSKNLLREKEKALRKKL